MCTRPPVIAALAKRMMDRTRALAFHLAVTQVTRVVVLAELLASGAVGG